MRSWAHYNHKTNREVRWLRNRWITILFTHLQMNLMHFRETACTVHWHDDSVWFKLLRAVSSSRSFNLHHAISCCYGKKLTPQLATQLRERVTERARHGRGARVEKWRVREIGNRRARERKRGHMRTRLIEMFQYGDEYTVLNCSTILPSPSGTQSPLLTTNSSSVAIIIII